jgi:hydrogenase maturation protein HypF
MTYQLHLTGIVQGVGFRPMVYALAKKNEINGTVSNSAEGVVIQFNAEEEAAHHFYKSLLLNLPSNSKVTHHQLTEIKSQAFSSCIIPLTEDSITLLSHAHSVDQGIRSSRSHLKNT